MKTLLLIAFRYPPYSASGAWRPYFLAKHLASLGWRSIVVTVQKEDCRGTEPGIDIPLPGTIEVRTRLVDVRQWVERWGRRLWPTRASHQHEGGTPSIGSRSRRRLRDVASDLIEETLLYPDEQVGWILPAVRAGLRVARIHGCDAIYATGGPWSSLLIGVLLKRLLRRPLVAEFRDPWYRNPYKKRKFFWNEALDLRMERWVLRAADRVVTVTHELGEAMVDLHGPWLREKLVTVTNGYEILPSRIIDSPESESPTKKKFRLIHAGVLYGQRNVCPLLEACADLIREGDVPADSIQLDLVGEVHVMEPCIRAMLKESPLCDVVRIQPRLPFAVCQELLAASDLLLILQPAAPLQIPRKLFDYLAFAKPIVAITSSGATANLVQSEELGEVVPNDSIALKEALARAYWAFRTGRLKGPNAESRARYANAVLAQRVDALLTEMLQLPTNLEKRPLTDGDDVESQPPEAVPEGGSEDSTRERCTGATPDDAISGLR